MLEGVHLTHEHIVPHAIGGRREVSDSICKTCNSNRGRGWEAEVAKQFLWFSSAAGVKRERGASHPDFRVQTATGEKLKLRADSMLVLDGDEVFVVNVGDRLDASIRASDPVAIKNLIAKVARDAKTRAHLI